MVSPNLTREKKITPANSFYTTKYFSCRCKGDLKIPAGKTACFYFFKEAIFDKASDGTYPRNECTDSYFNIFEKKDEPENGFKVCNGQGKAFMICSEPEDGSGERTAHVNLVAANSAINWSEMFYLYIGLCKFYMVEKGLKILVKNALFQMILRGKLSSLFEILKTIL